MTMYLRTLEKQKRRRVAFQDDQYTGYGNTGLDGNNSADDDTPFFLETIFTMNCVPDSPLPPTSRVRDKKAIESYGVLDTLPQGANINSRKTPKKHLSQEQASQISRKVIAWLLTGVGFEGATEAPVEELSAANIATKNACNPVTVAATAPKCSSNGPAYYIGFFECAAIASNDKTNASAVAANGSFSKLIISAAAVGKNPQAPPIHRPSWNMSIVRAPPVKVEGLSELMGGDTTLKHKSEVNKLTLPTTIT
ncbi:Transcription initiation factor TFIID subunit 8, putative isoform 2 [Hibiscus syriacus]|uniref:Transcription initiation factor TFIID subunit 8, putative isoform 2 n=1 Tax=Hibiscus syriacus TaxID=106335 RepID=A0A6A2ZWL8_HIBSY|nr:Transcription initiation factor TFIID subunit 8, putative isoform 2 [Hibiscus syriacus]